MMLRQFLNNDDDPIEFLCEPSDWDVIPKPYRAGKHTPDWFKKLSARINDVEKFTNSTIKRCPPFLDAMTAGWIIPLAADVHFISTSGIEDKGGLGDVRYSWTFYKEMVSGHSFQQINPSAEIKHPSTPKPPLKFLNYWMIKCKPGWSILFVPPLNRPDPRFECIAGLVDCDGYFEYVNFPFFFNAPNFNGIIPAGTPLVQAIPIRRDKLPRKAPVRIMTADEMQERDRTRRKRLSHESHYRDNVWSNRPNKGKE